MSKFKVGDKVMVVPNEYGTTLSYNGALGLVISDGEIMITGGLDETSYLHVGMDIHTPYNFLTLTKPQQVLDIINDL